MDGILLIDKPIGISSFGVVARVRAMLRQATGQKIKIGHTGTLDPAATGLMILVIGKATKRAGDFSKLDKTYEAEITLGSVSTTADSEGQITQKSTHAPSEPEVQAALDKFVGEIAQVPHAFSAIKVNGQRAYKLARAGKEVKIEPRKIKIYSIKDTNYRYPNLTLTTEVSSGTYIRSLTEDIGKELNTGAYLSALRRTKVGGFNINRAHTLDSLNPQSLAGAIDKQG